MSMTLQAQIKWVDNLPDFKKAIEEGTGAVVAHTARVDKLTQSLGGSGLLGAANNYTAAVERMGGVEKLISSEKDKINTLLTKAIEKYQAIGQTAPDAMIRLAAATKQAGKNTQETEGFLTDFEGLVGRLTERFIVYEALRKAFDFSKEVLASTARLEDMAIATGISTDALQRLSYVATEFGVDADTMVRGVEQLSAKLANGDKNASAAVDELGLSVKNLLAAGPEEAFLQIAEAAGKVEDPMSKGGIASELFGGKLAKQLLPMLGDLRAKMEEVPKDAIISDANIKAAKEFEVGPEHLEVRMKSWTVTVVDTMRKGWTQWGDFLTNQHTLLPDERAEIDRLTKSFLAAGEATKPTITNAQLLENRLKALRADALVPLSAEQKKHIDELNTFGISQAEIAKLVGTNEIALKLYATAHAAAALAAKKHETAIQGVTAASAENLAITRLLALAHEHQAADLKYEETLWRAQEKAIGSWIAKMPEGKVVVDNATGGVRNLSGAVQQVSAAAASYQGNMAHANTTTAHASNTFHDVYQALGDVSTILNNIPGKFSEIASVAARTGQAIMKNLADGNVWGAVVAGATGALQIFTKLFGTAGRDAVKDFAASFGGFDTLHTKLLALGAAGEALWVKLTQGVGRNNPAQAKAVIDQINQALSGQDAYLQRLPGLIEKYGLSWEQAGQQAKQAHLDEIAQGLIQDFADLSKAGFDVTLITEKMGTAINDYIHQAMATGTEVPAAMKPLIEKMIEMGTLTDANGNAITSLEDSGINFATTLTAGFQSIVDAIHELTRALGGVPTSLDIDVNYHTHGKPADPTGADGQEPTSFHSGTSNVLPFVYAHRGLLPDEVPAILQTGEAVLNRRAVAAVGTGEIGSMNRGQGRGGNRVNLTVNVHRPMLRDKRAMRELAKEIAAHVPSVLKASGF